MKKIIGAISKFVIRFYLVVLIIAGILAYISVPRATHFLTNIDTDLARLLPENFASIKVGDEIRLKFKSTRPLSVIVENKDPEMAKDFALKLAAELEKDPEVDFAEHKKRGYDFFNKHKLLFVDLDDLQTIRDRIDRRIQKEKLGGLYIDFEEEDSGGSDKNEFKFGDLETKYKSKYSMGVRSEYYTNDEGTVYVLYVNPVSEESDIKTFRKFYHRIKADVDKFTAENPTPGTKIYYSDSIKTRVDEYDTLMSDLVRAGIISGVGIFLVLLIYFRRFLASVIIFLPLTTGIIISFAFSSLFIDNLNLVTSFLFAILGGLGVEVGIHMLSRYIEERRLASIRGVETVQARHDAMFTMLYHTGGSALTSAATVAATFFILVINDFKGFSEFGFIAGFGLVFNYLIFVFVFPSLLVLAEKLRILKFSRGIGFDRISSKKEEKSETFVASRFPLPKFVLLGLGILLIISIFDLTRVNFEWRFSKIKANLPISQEAKSKQRETSKSVNSPAAVIIKNRAEAEAVKKAIDEIKAKNPDTNVVDGYKSYYDLVPSDQNDKMTVVGEMKHLLADKTLKLVKGEHKKDLDKFKEALNETELIEEDEVPKSVRDIFKGDVGQDSSELAYINPLPELELDNGLNAIRFAEQIEEIKTPLGTFRASSDAIVFADVLRTMISDGKRVVVLAFLIVFIIVWLDFRKISAALLVISPIVIGIVYMFGIMYVLDIRLNFYNIVVIPTSVGTSIDNSIHLYHRYKELGKGSIMAALKSSGSAALTSSLTNIFGFLGLLFTFHNGLKSIGELAVAGLVACLITTLVYFPALLQMLEDRK